MIRVLQWGMVPEVCGGVENFIMNVYRNIDRSKIQFDFLLFKDAPELYYEKEIIALGGRIYREYYSIKKNPILHYKSIVNFFRNHSEISVVHYNATALYDCDLLYMSYICHVPVRIIHSHNTNYNRKETKLCLNILHDLNKYLVYKYCNIHISCSYLAGRWLYGKRDFQIFNNGIDIKRFAFSMDDRIKTRKLLNLASKRIVLCVARLEAQKNPLYLIEVAKFLHETGKNDIVFLWAGEGSLRENIENKINEYKLDNFILLGNRQDIPQLMSASDIFVLPSLYEGFPITLVEAQTNGLPVLVSSTVENAINITGQMTFISIEENPEVWGMKILKTNYRIDRNQGAKVVKYKGFDIAQQTEKLKKIYEGEY